jgi:Exopolysaccharide biosynthesis protein
MAIERGKLLIKKILVIIYHATLHMADYLLGITVLLKYKNEKKIKKAILVGTPEHDNLGDHAIALAEIQFLQKFYPDYKIIEITIESWRRYTIFLNNFITEKDLFFITGGGNIGNIYIQDEKLHRYIISKFKYNLVTIFPQTIYFSPDKKGEKELLISQKIYNSHNKLIICAREQRSYDIMKQVFYKCDIYICPDIVFILDISFINKDKNGVVGICMRNDIEHITGYNRIKSLLNSKICEIFNTCLNHGIKSNQRLYYIKNIIEQISTYDYVITDRLHAIIFSVIAGVKCYAVPCISPKITSSMIWLKNKNVFLWNDYDIEIKAVGDLNYDKSIYEEYFINLNNQINKKIII